MLELAGGAPQPSRVLIIVIIAASSQSFRSRFDGAAGTTFIGKGMGAEEYFINQNQSRELYSFAPIPLPDPCFA